MKDEDCYNLGDSKHYDKASFNFDWKVEFAPSKKEKARRLMQKAKELFGEENP
jgi:hypothetical protein